MIQPVMKGRAESRGPILVVKPGESARERRRLEGPERCGVQERCDGTCRAGVSGVVFTTPVNLEADLNNIGCQRQLFAAIGPLSDRDW